MASTTQSTVPFMDLRHVNVSVADLVLADVADTIAGGAFVEGPAIARFERMFADYVAEALSDQLVSLPVSPGITDAQLARVVAGVKEYFRNGV